MTPQRLTVILDAAAADKGVLGILKNRYDISYC